MSHLELWVYSKPLKRLVDSLNLQGSIFYNMNFLLYLLLLFFRRDIFSLDSVQVFVIITLEESTSQKTWVDWRVREFGSPDTLWISLIICAYGPWAYVRMNGQIIALYTSTLLTRIYDRMTQNLTHTLKIRLSTKILLLQKRKISRITQNG